MKLNIVLFFILLFTAQIFSQDAEKIVLAVQKKFDSIKDMKAKIVRVENNSQTYLGDFYFAKNDKYRIEFQNRVIVSDGKNIWQFNKKLNRVVILNVADDENNFSLPKIIFEYPKKCKAEIVIGNKTSDNYVIKFTPINNSLNFNWTKLSITNKYIVEQFEMKTVNNSLIKIKFNDIRINTNINRKTFQFKIPNGVKVVDLR